VDRSHSVDPLRLGSAYLLSAGRLTRPFEGPLRFAIAHLLDPPLIPPHARWVVPILSLTYIRVSDPGYPDTG